MLFDLRDRFWRTHWIPWLLLIALIVLAGFALPTFLDYRRAAMDLVIEVDQRVTQLSAVRIRDELSEFPNALVALARTQNIASKHQATQIAALREALPIREGLFDGGIVLLDNFGRVAAAEPPRPQIIGQDWSDRTFFRQLLTSADSTVVFSNATDDGPEGSQVIVVSVPILGGDGRFLGALAGMLRLGQSTVSPFYASIVRLRVGGEGTAYLVDGTGKILFDSASALVGQQYADHQVPGSGNAEAVETTRIRDASGHEIVAAHAPIPATPWTLVIEKDWERLTGPTRQYVDLLLIVLGLGAVLPATSVAVWMGQRSTRLERRDEDEQEMRLARQIVTTLLPDHAPVLPGWEIAVHIEPSDVAGGAFHDLLLGMDGRLMLSLGEVGNSGVPAALTMAALRTTLRGVTRCAYSPVQALERSNEMLCPDLAGDTPVACLYCILDPSSGRLSLANAGHTPALHVARTGISTVDGQGPFLVQSLNARYSAQDVLLEACDTMVFCSSSVVNAKNAQGEAFGLERLKQIVNDFDGSSADLIAAIVAGVRRFAGGAWSPVRDATIVALRRLCVDVSR